MSTRKRKEKTMGSKGHDRFDASSSGFVYEERSHNRTDARHEESLSQGDRIGPADADLLSLSTALVAV